jgi:ketosteroid isomerase-like protein
MTMLVSRASEPTTAIRSRWGFVALLLVAACSGATGPQTPDDDRRRPDGVAIDPASSPALPRESAQSSEGVVVLQTPLGTDAARTTVRNFFTALTREDAEALRELLAGDALTYNPTTRGRENAIGFYTRRFYQRDYFSLAAVTLYQDDGVELYRAHEAEALWTAAVGSTGVTAPASFGGASPPGSNTDALITGDVVVRVTITLPRTMAATLMGDTFTFLLRRNGGRYVVARIVEDYALP